MKAGYIIREVKGEPLDKSPQEVRCNSHGVCENPGCMHYEPHQPIKGCESCCDTQLCPLVGRDVKCLVE